MLKKLTQLQHEIKKTTINKPGPVLKHSTDYNRKVKVANKIKNKYRKKIIDQKKQEQ